MLRYVCLFCFYFNHNLHYVTLFHFLFFYLFLLNSEIILPMSSKIVAEKDPMLEIE